MEIEIYRGGAIEREVIQSDRTYEFLLSLIKCLRTHEGKSLFECILSEICFNTSSDLAEIWKTDGSDRTLFLKHKTGDDSFPFDRYVKRYDGNISIVSQDMVKDLRFRLRSKASKAASLPAKIFNSPRKKLSTRSGMIILLSDGFFLALKGVKKYKHDIQDVKRNLELFNILKIAVENDESLNYFSTAVENMEKARHTDSVKDIFLANVSHELRTPLNGIVGMITMLKDAGPLNDKQQEYLTILMECSHQLMNMMNDLLDFSKIVSKRLALVKGPLDISSAVSSAVKMVEGKAKAKKLDLRINIQPQIPVLIGDGQRLTQIITNLLANAVKFTERGNVNLNVTAKLDERNDDLPYVKRWKVCFTVKDTGIGISREEQGKIFEVFHQSSDLNAALSRSGTGLGLSICKELTKLMGGSITVESEGIEGKGSIFSFNIFAEEEIKMQNLQENHKEMIKGAKIMAVDDRAEYRIQLTSMLLNWGCEPVVVASGEEVLQYTTKGIVFDVIIVDICMPYMSGIELAQELKAHNLTNNTPLIALSSVDLTSGADLFDVYMTKPIDQNLLFPALLECLMKKKGRKISRSTSPFPKKEKKPRKDVRILIAEDDANNTYTITEMLGYLGFDKKNIKSVENGERCVAEVKKSLYDVVLMDIKMPIMDGIEATKYIRQMKRKPYIIAVSAAVQNSDKQRCQQVGIDGYLPKPVLKEKLLAALSPVIDDV